MNGTTWPWSYGSLIYNYLCNQCLPPLMLWIRISVRARCTTLCDKICQWLVTGRWFSAGPLVSSTNKTDRHDISEILLKVELNTIILTPLKYLFLCVSWIVLYTCEWMQIKICLLYYTAFLNNAIQQLIYIYVVPSIKKTKFWILYFYVHNAHLW